MSDLLALYDYVRWQSIEAGNTMRMTEISVDQCSVRTALDSNTLAEMLFLCVVRYSKRTEILKFY